MQAAQSPNIQPGLDALVTPRAGETMRMVEVDSLSKGLHSILVQWAYGKNTFGWLRSVGAQHVEIRVRDGSDEDQRALIFSIAPLPQGRVTQEFRVSTEGRGLLGQIATRDNRMFASLRGSRDLWQWSDLESFIVKQGPC